ncbi:MAG: ArgE/DapE family deacylase [Bacillota bacterium]|nr:ArgE/DapE family deacylase [Bacillota bacterium]
MSQGTDSKAANLDPARVRVLLEEMVAIDSTNPSLVPGGAGEERIARYVAGVLERAGFEAVVEAPAPGRPNAVGVLRGTGGGRSLMLVGHLDTVSTEGMDIAPLAPRVEDGRLYGRGACDMKGGLAAILAAVEAVAASGWRPAGDLIVAGVSDEEYASIGVEHLVRRWRADAGVIAEPTGLDLVIAHKGFAWVRVDVEGVAAHGSSLDGGVDAITQAAKVITAYDDYQRRELTRVVPELVTRPSLHASLIRGGRELSTYPDHCRVEFERRTVPGETEDAVRREIQSILDRLAKDDSTFRASADVFFYRQAYQVARDEPVVTAIVAACRKVVGHVPGFGASSGWMDSAVMGAAGIPTVIFGPAGSGAHSAVEWVDLESVVTTARVLTELVRESCAAP